MSWALVTGGSSGIGLAFAERIAKRERDRRAGRGREIVRTGFLPHQQIERDIAQDADLGHRLY